MTYAVTGRASNSTNSNYNSTGDANGAYVNYPFSLSSYAYTGGIGAVTGEPSGNTTPQSQTGTLDPYSNNSFEKSSTVTWGLDRNLPSSAPFKSVRFHSYGLGGMSPQYEFTPGIPKDNTKTLALTYKIGWGRRP